MGVKMLGPRKQRQEPEPSATPPLAVAFLMHTFIWSPTMIPRPWLTCSSMCITLLGQSYKSKRRDFGLY
jgi:hypothetical protein